MSGSSPPVADPPGDEIVIHDEPVRIPVSALPSRPLPAPPGSSFATTFVIGVSSAPWFAAAWITGGPVANAFAAGWALVLLVNLLRVVRRSRR